LRFFDFKSVVRVIVLAPATYAAISQSGGQQQALAGFGNILKDNQTPELSSPFDCEIAGCGEKRLDE
jgi:hypothetical protein